jgi:hypothetical protein
MIAGAGGVAAMTIGEKLERRVTGRPSSYMPAHTGCSPSFGWRTTRRSRT